MVTRREAEALAAANPEWAARLGVERADPPAAEEPDRAYLTLEAWLISQGHTWETVMAIPERHKVVLMDLWKNHLIGPPLECLKMTLAVNVAVDRKSQKTLDDFLPRRFRPPTL